MEEPKRLEEAAGAEPNSEEAGAVVAAVGADALPKGEPEEDPNTDVEDCCGAAVVAGADDPKIEDPEGLKTEEEALEEPKGEEAAGAAPKLLLAPNSEDPCDD